MMSSFYLWTQLQLPAGYKATGPTALLDDARQQRVIENLRSIDGLCLLENVPLARRWRAAVVGVNPPGPLDRYLDHGFVPIAKFGDYELLQRDGVVADREHLVAPTGAGH
jgi:hypothetical protein